MCWRRCLIGGFPRFGHPAAYPFVNRRLQPSRCPSPQFHGGRKAALFDQKVNLGATVADALLYFGPPKQPFGCCRGVLVFACHVAASWACREHGRTLLRRALVNRGKHYGPNVSHDLASSYGCLLHILHKYQKLVNLTIPRTPRGHK